MPKPNAYLARQEQIREARDLLIASWCCQICFDALSLVLNDPEVMDRDVFGKARLKKIEAAVNAKAKELLPGINKKDPASSYVRAMTDRELEKIFKEEFIPWPGRYDGWDDRGI